LLLWRKDLRANTATLIFVDGVSLLWAVLSLVERWRYPLVFTHLLFVPIGAALFLAPAVWATEKSQDTEVFFHSLPVSRRGLVRSRFCLTLLLTLCVLTISGCTAAYLLATFTTLIDRWQGGPSSSEVASFRWLIPNLFLLSAVFAAATALTACTWGPVCRGAWRNKMAIVVTGLAIAYGVGIIYDFFGVYGANAAQDVFVPEWSISATILLLLLSGLLLSRKAFIRHASLEHGRRWKSTLVPWGLPAIIVLAGCAVLNARLSGTRYADTRSVQEALSVGDQFVAVVSSHQWGRECYARTWQIDPNTGRASFMRRGQNLKNPADGVFTCEVPGVWYPGRQPNCIAFNVQTGAERLLEEPPAARRLRKSGASVTIDVHPISGNAIVRIAPKPAFLAGYQSPIRKTMVYTADTGQLAPLRLPGTSSSAAWRGWSDRGRSAIVSVGRRVPVNRAAHPEDNGYRQRLWRMSLQKSQCQPLTPSFNEISDSFESDDGHYLTYFTSSPGMPENRCDLIVTDTDTLHTWTISRNLRTDEGRDPAPRWSPDSRRLVHFRKEKTHHSLWLWDAELRSVRSVPLLLLTDTNADPATAMWHPAEQIRDSELIYRDASKAGDAEPYSAKGPAAPDGEWEPGGTIHVSNLMWSPDSRYVALSVEERGDLKDHPTTKWQSWQRTRVSVCVVDTNSLRRVALVTVGDAVYDDWAPPFSPHKLDWDEQPQIEALAWTRDGKVACLMQDGSLLHVDPRTAEVRHVMTPERGRR